ncbi:hypothetical protein MIR68_011793 [Amoeboaphelidium protococcarum]|nr:hypothetical protein MIR68_011793 [Amoeboaphelidium protococcarum]
MKLVKRSWVSPVIVLVVVIILLATSFQLNMYYQAVLDREIRENGRDIFIAVMTSPQTIQRCLAIFNTWGAPERSQVTIRFFIGRTGLAMDYEDIFNLGQDLGGSRSSIASNSRYNKYGSNVHPFLNRNLTAPPRHMFIQLPTWEQNSHHITEKTLTMWKYLYKHQVSLESDNSIDKMRLPRIKYQWFLKIDDDTSVLIPSLVRMLSQYKDPQSKPYVIGRRIKTAFTGDNYILSGGAGYVLSSKFLSQFAPNVNRCRRLNNGQVIEESLGEDVVLSWCVKEHFNVTLSHNDAFTPHLPRDIEMWREWDRTVSFYPTTPVTIHYAKDILMYELDYFLNMYHNSQNAANQQQQQQYNV